MKSFKEQFDKLTSAYIHNKVEPYEPCACFIGNLFNGGHKWANVHCNGIMLQRDYPEDKDYDAGIRSIKWHGYTPEETFRMEENFMTKLRGVMFYPKEYEDRLFEAFSSTLDILREIHIAKGEIIDETPVFTKRQKQTA